MERKAKLGYKAVIADKNGKPKIVSARYLVRKIRARKKALMPAIAETKKTRSENGLFGK